MKIDIDKLRPLAFLIRGALSQEGSSFVDRDSKTSQPLPRIDSLFAQYKLPFAAANASFSPASKNLAKRISRDPPLNGSSTPPKREPERALPKSSILSEKLDPLLQPDARLLAHLTADALIGGTDLEGETIKNTLTFRLRQLEFLQEEKGVFDPEKIEQFCKTLLTLLVSEPKAQAEAIANLKIGDHFLILGGWQPSKKSPTGHAMMYDFQKQENGYFRLSIYNTGAGLQFHENQTIDRQEKYKRVLQFADVFPEELGLSSDPKKDSPHFFEAIQRYREQKIGGRETNAEAIYNELFGHLAHKQVAVDPKVALFAIKQRSGTCGQKILDPFTFYHLCEGDNGLYKRLHFFLNYYATIGHFQKMQDSREFSDESLYLLETSATKLLRTTAKLYSPHLNKKLLTDREMQEAQDTLIDLQNQLEKIEKRIKTEQSQEIEAPLRSLSSLFPKRRKIEPANTRVVSSAVVDLSSLPPAPLQRAVTWQNLAETISTLLQQAREAAQRDPHSAIYQMEDLIDHLPSSSGIDKLTKKEADTLLGSLHQLMECYAPLSSVNSSYFPARQNRALQLLGLIYQLALHCDALEWGVNAKLGSFLLNIPLLKEARHDPYLVFYDPQEFEKRRELTSLFPIASKEQSGLFLQTVYFYKGSESPKDAKIEAEYIFSLLRANGALSEKFDGAVENMRDRYFSPEQWRIAHALTLFSDPEFANAKELKPLCHLKAAVLLFNLFFDKHEKFSSEASVRRASNESYGDWGYSSQDFLTVDFPYKAVYRENAHSMHHNGRGSLPDHRVEFYPKQKSDLPLESALMDYNFFYRSIKVDDKPLVISNCEPSLQPTGLFAHYEPRIELLVDQSERIFFETQLFKFTKDGKYSAAIFEELPQSPSLQKQSVDFIQKGLDVFWRREPGRRPNVPAALFFVRLAMHLKNIAPALDLPDLRSILDGWLENQDLTSAEKADIHLHRFLLLGEQNLEEMDDPALLEVLKSWFVFQQNCEDSLVESPPYLTEMAKKHVYGWASSLKKRLQGSFLFGDQILKSCGLTPYGSAWKVKQFPVYTQQEGSSFWQMNLLTGEIANEEGKVTSAANYGQLQDSSPYKRLFGAWRGEPRKVNRDLLFDHPEYGMIRVSLENRTIQRYWNGEWLQYVEPDDLPKDLPLPLIADHSHWISLPSHFLLSPFFNRTIELFSLQDPSYSIAKIHAEKIALSSDHASWVESATAVHPSLQRFEREDCILGIEPDHKLRFPRYRSLVGEELHFTEQTGAKWEWGNNPGFSLHPYRRGLLGTIPNYLIVGSGAEEKLLVPMRPIRLKKSFDRNIELDVFDEAKKKEYAQQRRFFDPRDPERYVPQQGCYTYLEYSIGDQSLKALNTEGTLYYVYLLLAQKEYEKALDLFKELPRAIWLSATSQDILRWIWDLHSLNQDMSPSAQAVRLYAASFLKDPPDWREAIAIYHQGRHYIPPKLRLIEQDPLEESLFESADGKYITQAIRSYLATYTPEQIPQREDAPATAAGLLQQRGLQNLEIMDRGDSRDGYDIYFQKHSIPYRVDLQRRDKTDSEKISLNDEFGSLYRDALAAKTALDKLQFSTRLHPYALKPNSKGDFEGQVLLSLLHFALIHPQLALEIPDESRELHYSEWLNKALSKYRNFSSNGPTQFVPIRLPTLSSQPNPLPVTASLPSKLPPANVEPFALQLPSLAREKIHPLHLHPLAKAYFREKREETFFEPVDFTQNSSAIGPSHKAIQTEIQDFQKNYEIGRQKRAERKSYLLSKALPDFRPLIQKQSAEVETFRENIERLIQKNATDIPQKLYETALVRGRAISSPDLNALIDCFLEGEVEGYAKINPHLTKGEIQQLDETIYRYLLALTELQQIKRASALKEQLAAASGDLESIQNELAETLLAQVGYDPATERVPLVFEAKANLRLRPGQLLLIQKLVETDPNRAEYRDLVAQLMPGEGKTTTVAPLLLKIAALAARSISSEKRKRVNPGHKRFNVVIAPAAQFESLRSNLPHGQKKHLNQEVVPVDFTREELTLKHLHWLQNKLEAAQRGELVFLMKAEGIQSLQLEFLSLLYQRAHQEANQELDAIVLSLQKILHTFATSGDIIIDEVDVVLAPNKVLNFPIGDKTLLPPHVVSLIRTIVSLHCSDQIQIELDGEKISLAHFLALCEKKQVKVDLPSYRQKALPLVASALFDSMFAQSLPLSMKGDFESYVMGKTPSSAFLKHLETLSRSTQEKEQMAADLAALSKEILTNVFPVLLHKEVNRHFGRAPHALDAKVIPYLAASSPAPTEFGNPWEAAIYQFFTALKQEIQPSQIRQLAEHAKAIAERQADEADLLFDETEAAQDFLELTGVDLSSIACKGELEKAHANINASLEKILDVEGRTVAEVVGFYENYLSSNAQNIVDQLATRRAFSGTPGFRAPCYHDALKDHPYFEPGVEGQIADQLIRTCDRIYTFQKPEVANILDSALEGGIPKKRLRALIDTAGVLKDIDNEEVARQINQKLGYDLLFFGRKSPKEVLPDCLMVFRNGKVEIVGSTDAEELKKHNIDTQKSFVYFDERHTEATNIRMEPDAISIQTFSEITPSRTLFQGALRARKFFQGQRIVLMVSTTSQKRLPNQGKTAKDLIQNSLIVEALDKSKETYRSYFQKIAHIPRQEALNHLLNMGPSVSRMSDYFLANEALFVHKQDLNSLYVRYGRPLQEAPAEGILKQASQSFSYTQEGLAKVSLLLKDAHENPYVPSIALKADDTLGQEMQLLLETQQEIKQEVQLEQEIEQELTLELKKLQYSSGDKRYIEEKWNPDEIVDPQFFATTPRIFSLPDLLQGPIKSDASSLFSPGYSNPYHNIFDSSILISKNLVHTLEPRLSVFDVRQKFALKHLVIYRDGELKILMLSTKDAAFFHKYLKNHKPNDLWLIHSTGREISDHPHTQLDEKGSEALQQALMQVHIFNGDARALSVRKVAFEKFLTGKNRDLVFRFLKLKVEKQPFQRSIFYSRVYVPGK